MTTVSVREVDQLFKRVFAMRWKQYFSLVVAGVLLAQTGCSFNWCIGRRCFSCAPCCVRQMAPPAQGGGGGCCCQQPMAAPVYGPGATVAPPVMMGP
ncbi:hypothetical protein Pan216_52300 [Planctomycetes bacterium Pan216]|uniref:Uncharacterized protein n=1 Tax=Kolteria novifilia TaxID=2527975 RepID=A0A518BBI0_9BACT|nr:hypothetical protein Pan216_52300 [Planctomycetes bacterium Pan216]